MTCLWVSTHASRSSNKNSHMNPHVYTCTVHVHVCVHEQRGLITHVQTCTLYRHVTKGLASVLVKLAE